jgi:hypothetical protein
MRLPDTLILACVRLYNNVCLKRQMQKFRRDARLTLPFHHQSMANILLNIGLAYKIYFVANLLHFFAIQDDCPVITSHISVKQQS